jgi:glutamate/tyrosine decarboxylase-like PLP-dependent enzyme
LVTEKTLIATELDLSSREFAEAASEIVEILSELRGASETTPVLRTADADDLARRISGSIPRNGTPIHELLAEIKRDLLPFCRRNDSPRFFGYVCSGGSDAGTLADFLASGLNQNVTAWRSAPAAAEMERLVVEWLREITGLPEGSEGLLLGGGSSANLTALAVARDAKAGADVSAGGLLTLGREMTLYASDEAHMSIARAASLLGIGRENLRILPSTPEYTIDLDSLRGAVASDRRDGRLPFCVVANAGSTNTGAVDPLAEIASLCRAEGLWLHVDGSYGGLARLAPSAGGRLESLGEADSVAVDPHKWLHVPFDCGALLVRDASALKAPFSEVGAYARTREAGARAAFTFFEHGPELSRRFRALKVWMVMRHLGTDRLGRLIDHDLAAARSLAVRIERAPDLELLAPVPLSTVCFRYAPGGVEEGDLDPLNRRILEHLQSEARVYPTHAQIKGRFAIRACILNPRTTESDLDLLVEEVKRLGREASGA